MNNLFDALQTKDALTENAMVTHSTSGKNLVDMFFKMGGSRNMGERDIAFLLRNAMKDDPLRAVKAVFYNRDIRGGQGERRSFRIFWGYLCANHPDIAARNIPNVPFYGRWDDLFSGLGIDGKLDEQVLDYVASGLIDPGTSKLCAKWMPREGKSRDDLAKILMRYWDLSPREYRNVLARNTKVIETLMSNKQWSSINYEQVPSVAMKKYRKAFHRNDKERFQQYLDSVEKGEKKINASAIFPHDIVRPYLSYYHNNFIDKTLELQWNNLPDYMPKGQQILPVCDVSGSMMGLPMEVCISLGLYLAERNQGPYHNGFITFSARPQFQYLQADTLAERTTELLHAHWETNTNLEAVFNLILRKALDAKLSEDAMPETLLILSDMQFDRCVRNSDNTAMEMIKDMYSNAGYRVPNIVFWNLRTSSGVPAKVNEQGVALVSGFSPSIMMNILGGEMSPLRIVYKTLDSERYSRVVI